MDTQPPEQDAAPEPAPARVFVVDDSERTNDVLVSLLELEGHHVVPYLDPIEALAAIKADPPDLVLLDVMMPGMTGMQVLEQVRAHGPTVEMPVIMLTALSETQDMVRGLDLGANDYLVKPAQYEVLVARVNTQLKLKRLLDQRRKDLEELRELNTIKDKFLQIAAHDLRNPINNFMIGLEILKRIDPGVKAQISEFDTILSMMDSSALVMRSMVNDFLDLQVLRSGKVKLEKQVISINKLVELGHHAESHRRGEEVD